MINRNAGRIDKPSFVPKFSDPDIVKALINSDFWRHVFLGEKKAVWLVFKAIFSLKLEMFVSPLRIYLRCNHGRQTIGIIITLLSGFMTMAFNTKSIVGTLATFIPLIAPVVPFLMSSEELKYALLVDIRSKPLMFFWMVYGLLSLVHLMRMYRGWGEPPSPTDRGTSLLYLLIFKHLNVPETVVQRLIEPIGIGLTGYFLMSTETDFTFGLFLIIAAGCLFIQEGFDAVMRFSIA